MVRGQDDDALERCFSEPRRQRALIARGGARLSAGARGRVPRHDRLRARALGGRAAAWGPLAVGDRGGL